MRQFPIAIVGLGLMGEVYAQRLIDAGIPVTGFDIADLSLTRDTGSGPGANLLTASQLLLGYPQCSFCLPTNRICSELAQLEISMQEK